MKTRKRQRGMTLIELMIALTVLTVGLLSLMGLIATAVATNNRNKLDTGGTFVAQAVLETIAAQPSGASVALTDCAGNALGVGTPVAIVTAGTNAGVGANLKSDGSIDFTQAASSVTSGYQANYVGCGTTGKRVTYDVRWNIRTIASGTGYNESLITVGAAQKAVVTAQGTSAQARFANPVTLRTISATGN